MYDHYSMMRIEVRTLASDAFLQSMIVSNMQVCEAGGQGWGLLHGDSRNKLISERARTSQGPIVS